MKKIIATILSIVAIALPQAAIAQDGGNEGERTPGPYRFIDPSNQKTYLYIFNQTPSAPITSITSEGAEKSRIVTLNNCGWGSFTKSTTSPPTLITGADWAGKTSGSAPTCVKDPSPATTYTTSNNAATGAVVDDGTKIWVRGGTGPGNITLGITANRSIKATANACGFARLAISATRPLTNFKIGTTNYTLGALPVGMPVFCRKVGATSVMYVPAE